MSEPNPPTKPPISEARRRANQRNAQLSTGPKTQSGKNKSKFNNLRSACYAQELILPGENPEELQERLTLWEIQLRAVTDPERYEVKNAVHASWRHDRMRRAETIALTEMVDKTEETFYDQKEQEARDLVARLPVSPGDCAQGLRNSTAGLTWMIGQIEIIAQAVTAHRVLMPSHRIHLIHLSGKRPVDMFTSTVVAEWDVLYLAVAAGQLRDPVQDAVLELAADRPPAMDCFEFKVRIEQTARRLPPADEAYAQLQQKLAAMRDELTERRELVALREERDLARAIEKAKVDAGPEGAKRQRVENSMDRLRRGSLKELRALQKSRPEQDDPDGTPDPGTDPDVAPAATEPAPSYNGSEPTEPAVPDATNGSVLTTGSAASVETLSQPVNTTSTDTSDEADPPQKCGDEPTCQNGSGEAEAADGAPALKRPAATLGPEAAALGGAPALKRPADNLGPEAAAPGGAPALNRPSGTLSQGEREAQREERARQINAYLGINGDRPEPNPSGRDPGPGGEANRAPPDESTGCRRVGGE
jgi:hypothetical protein